MCGVCSIGRSPDMAFAATASRRTRLQTVVPLSAPSDSAFGAENGRGAIAPRSPSASSRIDF